MAAQGVRARSVLETDLHHDLVLARGVHHLTAFPDGVASRLLHVDVLAGLGGPDARQGVPVVRGGDGDGVDVLVVEHPAHVPDRLGLVLELGLDGGRLLGRHVLIDVTEGLDVDGGDLAKGVDVSAALGADANERHVHPVVRAEHLAGGVPEHRARGRQCRRP